MLASSTTEELTQVIMQRADFLAALIERPREKRELVDDLGVSRSTVDRGLRDLECQHLVTRSTDGYVLTAKGAVLHDQFADFLSTSELTTHLDPVLAWIDPRDTDLPLHALLDATLTVATDCDPYAPVNRHVQGLQQASDVKALLPVVGLNAMQASRDQLLSADAHHDIVVGPGVAETIHTESVYTQALEEMRDTGRLSLSVSEEPIPYYVGVLDECMQLGVEDDDGVPQALVETEEPAAVEWATDVFTEFKRRARQLV